MKTVFQTPEIQTCNVQLNAGGTRVAQADCSAPGLTPPTTWISGNGLDSLQASWEAVYTNKISMPDRLAAPNVRNSPVPIGVTDSSLIVAFSQGSTNTSKNNLSTTLKDFKLTFSAFKRLLKTELFKSM